ncbi:hypothetical protein MVLG_02725 [Microbotryum lychnidis-dioicae p1A1 Lamole]|uniref:Uncharacterized protein n=1 Tax=Microbotryum lychnidis-dioicae (strain p1A1 Lamole / MvSl-1064) TaxID=683840 RepID=U5H618_USTV1|nr:hypothetical protein MVLG_02725 [Microbotryum lychnidis-dioicae p1A1 Lamole]|eukprot:KDE06987.1 hypothetical protein MVLG_02725 [Microbotryum lychnidis-dioicae p1A1 Lamole]
MKEVRGMPGGASVPLRDRREPLKPLNFQSGARKFRTKTKPDEERWIEIERKHVQVTSSYHEVFAAPPLPRTKGDRQARMGSTLELPTSRVAVQTESSQVQSKRRVQPTPSDSDMNPSSSPIEPGWILDDSGKVVKVSPDWEEEPQECEWAMRKGRRADDVVARCRQLGTRELSSASPPLHSPITLLEAKWEAMRRDVPSNRSIQVALVNDLLLGAVARGLELNRMTRKRSVDATQDQPSENLVRPAETSEPRAMPTCRNSTGPAANPTIETPNKPLPKTTHLEPSPLAELQFIPRSPNPPSNLFLNPREYYVPYLELPERTKLQLLQRAYASSSTSLHPRTKELPFDCGEGGKGQERGRGENLPRVWGNAPEVESLVAWVGSGIGPG